MANPTQVLIASYTVPSGGVSSYTFSSIPQTYTDLILRTSVRSGNSGTNANLEIKFNSITSGYYSKGVVGNGSTLSGQSDSNAGSFALQYTSTDVTTANTFGNAEIRIFNYAGSTPKTISSDFVSESNASTVNYTGLSGAYNTTTAAITSIIISAGASLMAGSTLYLYGIKNS